MYEERANLRATIDASPLWDVEVGQIFICGH